MSRSHTPKLSPPMKWGIGVRAGGAAFALVLATLLFVGCGDHRETVVSNGESPEQAARRLFPLVYGRIMKLSEFQNPEDLEGATVGSPLPHAADYWQPGDILAEWVLPDAASHVETGMFSHMIPARLSSDRYVVPMIKDGRSVCDFELWRDDAGDWVSETHSGPLVQRVPGGRVYAAQEARALLELHLGPNTEVRRAVFLPSGFVFAVGRNGDREAAVYQQFVNGGPGVGYFDEPVPRDGQLFTSRELAKLLTP